MTTANAIPFDYSPETFARMELAKYSMPVTPLGYVDYKALRRHGEELYTYLTDADKEHRAVVRDAAMINSTVLQPLLVFYNLPTLGALRQAIEDDDLSDDEALALERLQNDFPELFMLI